MNLYPPLKHYLLLILLGLVLGGMLGVIGDGMVGAGAGIVTGMQAGACLTVEAAKDKGLITAEQVDDIFAATAESLAAAAGDLKAQTQWSADTDFADTDAECREFVAQLKQKLAEGR